MKGLFQRLFRAMRLDGQLFEEVVSDSSIQGQSVWAVAIFAMATAFGTFTLISGTAVNIGLLTAMIGWYVWAFSIFYLGSRILSLKAGADRKTIMRVMAFACAPGIFRILGIIPKTTAIIFAVTSIWILVTAIFGLKKAFPESPSFKISLITIFTWVVATLFQAILTVTLLSVFGVTKS